MKLGILGGTFNPVHSAHLRHAIEVGEVLELDKVWLMPNSVPPHKTVKGLLPYDLRVELLHLAVRHIPMLEVCTLEGELEGPSYTWRTLQEFLKRGIVSAPEEIFLMLGVEDFSQLHTWKKGPELPSLTNLVVVPRDGFGKELFKATIQRLWPEVWEAQSATLADGDSVPTELSLAPRFPALRCFYLPMPRLDFNATEIRKRWLAGRCLHALMPEEELALLYRHKELITDTWRQLPS